MQKVSQIWVVSNHVQPTCERSQTLSNSTAESRVQKISFSSLTAARTKKSTVLRWDHHKDRLWRTLLCVPLRINFHKKTSFPISKRNTWMIHDLPAFLATLNDPHPSIKFTMETTRQQQATLRWHGNYQDQSMP